MQTTPKPEIKEEKSASLLQIDYSRIHSKATAADFYPNGKLLSDDQICQIHKALKNDNSDAVYSKNYLRQLGVEIERGGIVRMKDETGKFILYAVYKINFIEKANVLGEGKFAKVKVLQNLETLQFDSVLKVLIEPDGTDAFKDEALVNSELGRGDKRVLAKKIAKNKFKEHKLYMIQNRVMGKDLFDVLSEEKLTQTEQFGIALKAFKCIQDLHAKGKLHRDIKIENFMYDSVTGRVKEVDLAMVQKIGLPFDFIQGTVGCIAPEVYLYKKNYSTASDVYALGRLVQDVFRIRVKISIGGKTIKFGEKGCQTKHKFTLAEFADIRNLAKKMLRSNPKHRISLDEAYIELEEIQFRFHQDRLKAKTFFASCVSESSDVLRGYLKPENHKASGKLFSAKATDADQAKKLLERINLLEEQNKNRDPIRLLNKLRGTLRVTISNLTENYLIKQIEQVITKIDEHNARPMRSPAVDETLVIYSV